MTAELIRRELDGDVLVATIDRPPRNAVDGALHDGLAALFGDLRRDPGARSVLLTGAGGSFSAGGDFAWMPALDSVERLADLHRHGKQLIWDLLDIDVPIVCAVNGPAIGLGASIALLCDVVVMADTATIADPHVRVGIVAGDGGAAIWPLLVGPARAKQYLLTGDAIDAAEAERIGLVNEVVPSGELMERAMNWARRLAAGAPLALRYTKQAVNAQVKRALLDSFDVSTAFELVTFASEDHREALAALREKRSPHFEGR